MYNPLNCISLHISETVLRKIMCRPAYILPNKCRPTLLDCNKQSSSTGNKQNIEITGALLIPAT